MASPLNTTVTSSGHYGGPDAVGSPPNNEADSLSIDPREVAREVAEFHRNGLSSRRFHDLTAEKYLIHIDGEGDNQWADLYNGERIQIPHNLSGVPRAQNNLLRPMVDNMVAYHTTMPFRYVVDSRPDRQSRESGAIDQAFANYITKEQNLNSLFAEAMYMAAAYGHCPIHAHWRDDPQFDAYQPVHAEGMQGPMRGTIDCWVGDPFDTVYSTGATRGRIEKMTYARIVSAEGVRQAFPEVPGIEGSTKLASSSRFQRTVRKWLMAGNSIHGTAALMSGQGGDELIALIYREIPAGVDTKYPAGRLTIVALNGSASTDAADASGGGAAGGYGNALLLHDGPLPGGVLSSVQVYSANRFDDVLGKPFVADLDEDQVQLNQLETLVNEFVRRSVRAPLVTAGVIADDSAAYIDDGEIEIDPGTGFIPQYLELPSRHIPLLEHKIQRIEAGLFRKGGWQAASRGESQPYDAAAKVVALARADDTVHGPTNQRFRESAEGFMGICWQLMKQYGDVPWLVDVAGDEIMHLIKPYIGRSQLSEMKPMYRLTSGFGATTEAKAQQLMNLWQMFDPTTGERAISTRQFKKQYPDRSLWPDELDPEEMRERRAKVVNQGIREVVKEFREQYGLPQEEVTGLGDPTVEQAAQYLWPMLDKQYPIMMDDNSTAHLEALSTMTQDESEDSIVRRIAMLRQDQFFQWLSGQQVAQDARGAEPPAPAPGSPAAGPAGPAAGPAPPAAGLAATPGAGTAGTSRNKVANLTAAAREGAV
jgi:hypothetical protein